MPAAVLLDVANRFPAVRDLLLRYVQAATVQAAHTALSHGVDVIDSRLARWLVMCADRVDGAASARLAAAAAAAV